MHEPDKSGLGWLVMVGAYWAVQALYLISPIDLIPDVVPVIGFGDDLVGVLLGLFVTAFGVYKAFGDRIALPGAGREELPEREVIDVTPVPEAGFEGYTPRTEHADYEPLTPDELKAL